MLILIIGGAWQGKRAFAETLAARQSKENGQEPDGKPDTKFAIIGDMHLLIKEALKQGRDPREEIEEQIRRHPDVILTVDELGCGIVPVEAFDRNWRETTGRICCELACRADAVYRVTCGLATRIK